MAAQDYTSVVQQLYISYFGRPADHFGLQNFTQQLDAIGAPKTFAGLVAATQATPNSALAKLVGSFSTSAESTALYGNDNTQLGISKFVTAIYKNFLNREPDLEGYNFWVNAIVSGGLNKANAAAAITAAALTNTTDQGKIDALTVTNKLAVATSFTDALDTPTEFNAYAGDAAAATARALLSGVTNTTNLTAYQANVDATVTAIVTGSSLATTYQLTTGLDSITGTAGNDVIIGSISSNNAALNTLSALDAINGGAGVDTLKVYDEVGQIITLQSVTNVEIIEVSGVGAEGVRIDTSTNTDVTNVNVVKATYGAGVSAAATTDVSVSGVVGSVNGPLNGGTYIEVSGGKNVTINDASANGYINVGSSIGIGGNNVAPKGVVTIVDSNLGEGKIYVNGGTDVTITATSSQTDGDSLGGGYISVGSDKAASGNVVIVNNVTTDATDTVYSADINVTGGKTVNVTVNATSAAADTDSNNDVNLGDISVTGDGKTTSVTVKQMVDVTDASSDDVGGVKESNSIKFGALAKGDSVTVGSLTFTANADLTAAQVASAFAGLTSTDTQAATGPVKNGIYTGRLISGWTSAAASGDTVVFTSNASTAADVTNLLSSIVNTSTKSVAPIVTTTEGVAPTTVGTETENSAYYGNVNVNDAATASITTVSIDGYNSASIGADVMLTKLASLSLANSDGSADVYGGAAQFALNVNNVTDAVMLNGTTVTGLTVTAATTKSAFALQAAAVKNLTVDAGVALDMRGSTIGSADALQTVVVKGAGAVNLGTVASVGLKSFDASANTGGVTATVSANSANVDATSLKTYTFSQGADRVTLSSTTVDVAINLGAGDDSITLASGTTTLVKNIDGGTGTNTLVMTAVDAAAATTSTDFATKIDNFQKLSIAQITTDANSVVNLANLDNISYVISKGAVNNAGSTETSVVTFQGLLSGQSATVAGRTITATNGDLTAAAVEAAFLSGTSAGAAVVTGTLAGWTVAQSGTATDGALLFTATTAGNVSPNIAIPAATNSTAPTAPTMVVTNGTPNGTTAENGVVAFSSLAVGQSVSVGGVTISNTTNMVTPTTFTGNEVAQALSGVSIPGLTVSGSLNGFTVTGIVGANATLTATSLGNVANFTVSASNGIPPSVTTPPSIISYTEGVSGTAESAAVTFTGLKSGQSVTLAGVTVTAGNGDLSAAQVAAAFAGHAAGDSVTAANGTSSGTLTGYNTGTVSGNTVVFTSTTSTGDIADLAAATVAGATAPTNATAVTTEGGVGAGGTGTLTVNHMANNGTLELTGSGTSTTVTMTDATGTSDVFNIITKVTTTDIKGGIIDVAGVETLNVTSTDTVLDDNGDGVINSADAVETVSLTIKADSAKTINVTGNANTTLTWDATTTKVTMVDASTSTGKLVAESLVGGTMTIKGGSAADTLTTYGQQDVLQGGAGGDTLIVKAGANLATLTGGAGNDTFSIQGASSNVNSAATITDLSAGDKIVFAGAHAFTSTAIVLDSTAVFQDFANTAVKNLNVGELAWFQFGGNTYIVEDVAGSTTAFQNGTDLVVKITGLVDLSSASYNATSNILEAV